MDTTYNGWTNRQTWLINIWFMDGLDGQEPVTAEYLQEMVEEYIYDALESVPTNPRNFLQDIMDISDVNWDELADNHNSKIEE